LASVAFGNQAGTIASKKSGFAKWAVPAPLNSIPAPMADGREINISAVWPVNRIGVEHTVVGDPL